MEEQIHLRQEVGHRLGFAAQDGFLLQGAVVFHAAALGLEMVKGFDQEAAGAAGGVQDGLSQAGVGNRHHEPHHGPGGVELAGIARRVPHLPEHGLIQMPEGVDFIAGGEVDAIDIVDHVP